MLSSLQICQVVLHSLNKNISASINTIFLANDIHFEPAVNEPSNICSKTFEILMTWEDPYTEYRHAFVLSITMEQFNKRK